MAQNSTVRVGFLGDASQLAREAKRASQSVESVGTSAQQMGARMGKAFALSATGAATAAVALAKTAIGSASDLHESLSKSKQVFGTSAQAVQAWADDSQKNMLLTRQAAIEASATFGNLFVSMGMGQGTAAGLSTKLVGLAEDLKSFNNGSVEDALLALRSGLLGEAEPLRKYGVQLSAARIEAEAFALGLAKPVKNAAAITAANNNVAATTANLAKVQKEHGTGTLAAAQAQDKVTRAQEALTKATAGQRTELTAAQKTQAIYSIVLKDTAIAQGDLARTSDSWANRTAILHKQVGDLSTKLGERLLPYAEQAANKVSELVTEFDNGTGAGGRMRDSAQTLADVAKDLGEVLNATVVPAVRFFADHPDALKAIAESMVVYAAATKTAAFYSALIKPPPVTPGVPGAPGGGKGGKVLPLLGGPVGVGVLTGIAAGEADKHLGPLGSGGKAGKSLGNPNDFYKGADGKFHPKDGSDGYGAFSIEGLATADNDNADRRGRKGMTKYAAEQAATAKAAASATKKAADTTATAQKYAADQAVAIAKRKADAADALQKASDAMREALEDRKNTAKGIRDSLISSNSILRDGTSWTAKDLLSRFRVTMDKVKRLQAGISEMVRKGYDPTIVRQAADAGVGNLGAITALAHASGSQVRQANAMQQAIAQAAGATGTRVASQQPIVNVYIDGKQIAATVITKHAPSLARAVNNWNWEARANGHQLP